MDFNKSFEDLLEYIRQQLTESEVLFTAAAGANSLAHEQLLPARAVIYLTRNRGGERCVAGIFTEPVTAARIFHALKTGVKIAEKHSFSDAQLFRPMHSEQESIVSICCNGQIAFAITPCTDTTGVAAVLMLLPAAEDVQRNVFSRSFPNVVGTTSLEWIDTLLGEMELQGGSMFLPHGEALRLLGS